jgi:hypothetical protein
VDSIFWIFYQKFKLLGGALLVVGGVGGERWVVFSEGGLVCCCTEGNVDLYCWDLRLATVELLQTGVSVKFSA